MKIILREGESVLGALGFVGFSRHYINAVGYNVMLSPKRVYRPHEEGGSMAAYRYEEGGDL